MYYLFIIVLYYYLSIHNGYSLAPRSLLDVLDSGTILVAIAGIYNNIMLKNDKTKTVLLSEIHHRIKNNYQLIISIIRLEKSKIEDKSFLEILTSVEKRINALSNIHKELYRSDDYSNINMKKYVEQLVAFILSSFNTRKSITINTKIDISELNISYAIPIGIIINEAVTNSIKHAFNDEEKNNLISINMFHDNEDYTVLEITDNGKGMPEKYESEKSLRITIINSLVSQILGDMVISGDKGTEIKIRFHEV